MLTQLNIFDGRTKRSISLFEPLFKGVSTRIWRVFIEKCFEKTHLTLRSAIENLRLEAIKLMPFVTHM